MEVLTVVEWVTQAATLLMIASGIPPCISMWKTKSTANVPFLFFLLGEVNAVCYFVYGVLHGNSILIFLNGVSVVVTGGCILAYLIVAQSKFRPLFLLCCGLVYLIALYVYIYNVLEEKQISDTLGFCGCLISTFMLSTPFIEIFDCMKKRSCEGMSMAMLFGALMCSVSWYLYGNLLNDPYIYLPNIPGVISSLGKLALVWYFSDQSTKQKDV